MNETEWAMKEVGQRVRDLREQRGLSQAALAEAIGCQQQDISALERRGSNLTFTRMRALSAALNVEVASLVQPFGWKENRRALPSLHGFPFYGPISFPEGAFGFDNCRRELHGDESGGNGTVYECWSIRGRYPVVTVEHHWYTAAGIRRGPTDLPSAYHSVWFALDRSGAWHTWTCEIRYSRGGVVELEDWVVEKEPNGLEVALAPFLTEEGASLVARADYVQRVLTSLERLADDDADAFARVV